jgi:hypothetical protein
MLTAKERNPCSRVGRFECGLAIIRPFLGAWHDRKHVLTYVGVETYALDIDVQYRSGDRDIVIHEFRLDDGLITHEIVFSTGKSIVIRSRNVSPTTEVLS